MKDASQTGKNIVIATLYLMLLSIGLVVILASHCPDRYVFSSGYLTFGSECLFPLVIWLSGLGVLAVRDEDYLFFRRRPRIATMIILLVDLLVIVGCVLILWYEFWWNFY